MDPIVEARRIFILRFRIAQVLRVNMDGPIGRRMVDRVMARI